MSAKRKSTLSCLAELRAAEFFFFEELAACWRVLTALPSDGTQLPFQETLSPCGWMTGCVPSCC